MSYKILIIEDELPAYQRLFKQIVQWQADAIIYKQIYSIASAIDWFQKNKMPDLLFMDVHLSDGNSFEIFNVINITAPIIFTTAYDQYAIEAFKYNSLHYLLKPIDSQDLKNALDKFAQYQYSTLALQNLAQQQNLQETKFDIKLGNKHLQIKLEDICCFYAKEKLNYIFTMQKQSYPIEKSLDKLVAELDGNIFFRVNRHLLCKRDCITSYVTLEKSKLLLHIEPSTPLLANVSSERASEFKKWWEK